MVTLTLGNMLSGAAALPCFAIDRPFEDAAHQRPSNRTPWAGPDITGMGVSI
jgi:hypothetical protein